MPRSTEYSKGDLDTIALIEARKQAASCDEKVKGPVEWFVFVSQNGSTSLRVAWKAIDGETYSCGVGL